SRLTFVALKPASRRGHCPERLSGTLFRLPFTSLKGTCPNVSTVPPATNTECLGIDEWLWRRIASARNGPCQRSREIPGKARSEPLGFIHPRQGHDCHGEYKRPGAVHPGNEQTWRRCNGRQIQG